MSLHVRDEFVFIWKFSRIFSFFKTLLSILSAYKRIPRALFQKRLLALQSHVNGNLFTTTQILYRINSKCSELFVVRDDRSIGTPITFHSHSSAKSTRKSPSLYISRIKISNTNPKKRENLPFSNLKFNFWKKEIHSKKLWLKKSFHFP